MENFVLKETELKGIPLFFRGKVRDIYDLDDKLLIVATDRISAFDFILPTAIPDKGKILNQISIFWFNYLSDITTNHLITANINEYPEILRTLPEAEILRERSMLVKKTKRINVECVVRGYLSGSAWKEYQESGLVCGIKLPGGLRESDKLPEPIFTPAIKAISGHDINISEQQVIDNEGYEVAKILKEKSLELYVKATKYAEEKGIIIADTKFEFGKVENEIILIDEVLTPDSSRFWDKEKYKPGRAQESFDKQFVRDYLESINWNKEPPVPELPPEIVEKTKEKYWQAYNRLIG
ncbi:MAG TPA: phosphoribosylaminoimidazolesuccinocarboxamide synthase [Elusimicrobia bacterium]|jgi:phosphoribosylaminoimidazole-succinocarboxamide synthase|nr:phosphoribosylaminoimidazolesuccinocarboxamide synthase [Elusimicrobiota bacterium]